MQVFSEEWLGNVTGGKHPGPPKPPAIILEFIAHDSGQAAASWLEISKSRSALRRELRVEVDKSEENETATNGDCLYKCPELGLF